MKKVTDENEEIVQDTLQEEIQELEETQETEEIEVTKNI